VGDMAEGRRNGPARGALARPLRIMADSNAKMLVPAAKLETTRCNVPLLSERGEHGQRTVCRECWMALKW
jgi:hypothetical protein